MYHFRIIITLFSIASRFSLFISISSENSDLNCKPLETWKTVHTKMIHMLFSTSYDRFQERIRNSSNMLTKHGRELANQLFKNCIKHKQSQKIMKLVHVS
jgi:hypothetical protein